MKQNGYVFRKGDSWFIRYRESLIESGEVVRKQRCKKLCDVALEHARLKNPPDDVIEEAERFLTPINSGKLSPGKNVTLGYFVEHIYFVNMKDELRSSTLHGYKQRWSMLESLCKDFRLREFDTETAQRVLKDVAPRQMKSTLIHLKALLRVIFKHAIQQGYLPGQGNPIRDTTVPRGREGNETYAYSLAEEMTMIRVLPEPARTIVALASFGGLRRGELFGMDWANYSGEQIWVMQSVWEGIIDEPKTRKSKAPVPVIAPLRRMLDAHKISCGKPTSGPMFATMKGTMLNPNNVVHRQILPALNACHCGKVAEDHENEDHKFERDASLPRWRGWHGFRRGLATNLHDLGVDFKTISSLLRHANPAITQALYIKTLDAQQINAMQQLEGVIEARLVLSANV